MKTIKKTHPDWVLKHKKSGTEIKKINNKYYVYGVKSVYDKTIKRSKKVSLGILGSITELDGFIASEKQELRVKAKKSFYEKEIFSKEYGLAKWLVLTMEEEGMLLKLKKYFPDIWQFIVSMVYCRIGFSSPLKNVPFWLLHSSLSSLLETELIYTDQQVCDNLFILGNKQKSIHEFMELKQEQKQCVLMDATQIVTQSQQMSISKSGYNADMDFVPQFTLLYLYDATTLRPLYYRILQGNIREIVALKNTILASGIKHCLFIADKGFYSIQNREELEKLNMQYIIPLKRNNFDINYNKIKNIEQTDNYFSFDKRYIFYSKIKQNKNRTLCLFLDGKLKEQEKNDYLRRIEVLPESYTKIGFKEKVKQMGTMGLLHNTKLTPQEVYIEYKHRGEIEQFFDHYKNTIDADSSSMQREESLQGWMFINHLSMQIIYNLYEKLKTTKLNKKQTLNHKYSIKDTLMHLKSINKILVNNEQNTIITEQDKNTKTLLNKLKISIT